MGPLDVGDPNRFDRRIMTDWDPPCGWWGDFAALSVSEPTTVARTLDQRYAPRGEEQFAAWLDSLAILRDT